MKTYRVSKEVEFDAGHRVPLHDSKCRNPHGHRYRVVLTVEGELVEEGSSSGMVMDFAHIKTLLTKRVHDVYDHGFIVSIEDDVMYDWVVAGRQHGFKIIEVDWDPTAENMAHAIYEDLEDKIATLGAARLVSVAVWETPTSMACYGDSA